MAVAVSERAVAEIKKAAGARATLPKGLRVGIRGGGCTGFSYLFEWADRSRARRTRCCRSKTGKVRVFIDPKSLVYLAAPTLEFQTTMMGHGFKFKNPNAKGTCGCGESVQF